MNRFPISVIILTWNEASNIGPCLEHLAWAEDVIVVDSGSKDETTAVAQAVRPDVRIYTHPFADFGDQRNWAIDETAPRHEWILFLDADEQCDDACVAAIQQAVREPGEHVAYSLTCRNYFLGRWIKRCTLYPSWQVRLFKVGSLRYRKEGHGQREVCEGQIGFVKAPYDHYGFSKGVADWIARHNRYSTDELELIARLRAEPLRLRDLFGQALDRRRCLKRIAARVGCRPLAQFFYMYFIRAGFLDGWPGLMYCLLRVSHEIHITVKIAEREYLDRSQKIVSAPAVSPEPVRQVSDS